MRACARLCQEVWIQADPSGRFVLHVDLGLDKIFVWRFDEQKGELTPCEPPAVSLPPGDGPAISLSTPVAAGSTPFRRKARPSCSSTTMRHGPAGRAADDLHPAARVCRQQLLLRDPGLSRWPVRLCRQPAARQHRDLRRRPERHPDVRRGRMDAGELSPQLQLRPHRPVPLLLQSTSGQRRRLPCGSQDGRPRLHRLLQPRGQSFDDRPPGSGNGALADPPAGRLCCTSASLATLARNGE